MAMTFPSNPTTGQQYSVSGGPTYTWDGAVWKILTPGSQFSEQQFTATAGQTSFTVSGGYVIGAVDVYRNGVKLVVGVDFLATDLSTVVLTNAASAGDTIEVVKAAQILYADALKATNNLSDVGNAATARANIGAVNKAGDAMTGTLEVPSYLRVTAGGGVQRILMGNQDSGGVNKPRIFESANAGLNIGVGDTWTGSGGTVTKHIAIDDSGRVTMPLQPAFGASSSATSIDTSSTLPYDSAIHNIGNYYNTSTRKFTAPVSGLYAFYGHWRFETSVASMIFHRFVLKKNGTGVSHSLGNLSSRSTGNYSSVNISMAVYLNSGDYIQPYVECSTGTTFSISAGGECFFGGHLIG